MSDQAPTNHHPSPHAHKTTTSYVIGFTLSLVFTIIPYFMVVNQTVSGTALLLTILTFAVVQMLIQIFFFLHLGRGPKPLYNVVFFASTVGLILVVVGGSIVIINNLHRNMTPTNQTKALITGEGIAQVDGHKTGACEGQHANHVVTIINDKVSPLHTDAQKCDTLTFMNEDSEVRELAFGEHPAHTAYAGETEYIIPKHQNKTITLSEIGSYKFHDHLRSETAGTFSVRQ